jgi:hypothetical protein
MRKPRKGVALVLALVVVLVGGGVIALTFDIVSRYGCFSVSQRRIYVDHTTVLDLIQATKGWILANNVDNGKTMHAPGFNYAAAAAAPIKGSITHLNDLRFTDAVLSRDVTLSSGVGRQRAVVQVYDMLFNPEDVNEIVLEDPVQMQDFPPVYKLKVRDDIVEAEGEHRAPGTGTRDAGIDLDPDRYGAYLIRVRLYDNAGKLLRTVEEAFVQVFS